MDIARHEALRRGDDVRRHQHRVNRQRRVGAVATSTIDRDFNAVGRRHHRPGIDADHSRRQTRPVVHGVNGIDRKALEQTVVDHRLGTGKTFFARLENHHRSAAEIARRGERACRADQHRRVAVVAATVHQAALRAAPREVVFFAQRQGVHICAQPDRLARCRLAAAANNADHAGLGDAGVHLVDATNTQCVRHALRGANLFEAELRVRVKVAPERGKFRMHLAEAREQAAGTGQMQHQCPPAGCSTRRRGSTTKYKRSTTRLMIT
jgi:hypothetical protein